MGGSLAPFCCTEPEVALKRRFEEAYDRSVSAVMQKIERRVCGCDYGGNSWTTREQADGLASLLDLGVGTQLVDLGSGTGWPGLYLAKKTGCFVTLVDLPENGMQLARRRAANEGLLKHVSFSVSDAADLPFSDSQYDAVSHSDLLCCLVRKRAVLEGCRRIIRRGGTMAFTVISLAPGLRGSARKRALANAPDFVEADASYSILLEKSGWRQTHYKDLTGAYRASCVRQIRAGEEFHEGLVQLLGRDQAKERLEGWRSKLRAIDDGLFRRELFVCTK